MVGSPTTHTKRTGSSNSSSFVEARLGFSIPYASFPLTGNVTFHQPPGLKDDEAVIRGEPPLMQAFSSVFTRVECALSVAKRHFCASESIDQLFASVILRDTGRREKFCSILQDEGSLALLSYKHLDEQFVVQGFRMQGCNRSAFL
jgi:hypothetical protein